MIANPTGILLLDQPRQFGESSCKTKQRHPLLFGQTLTIKLKSFRTLKRSNVSMKLKLL
jgi:hypothetical protein